MTSKNSTVSPGGGYECVNCSTPVDSLYTSYFQQSNTSLLECSKCGQLADDYFSFPFSISLLNLLLLKPSVYRHLLRNRGGETLAERRKHRALECFKLAFISIFVDTLVRCVPSTSTSDDLETLELFVKTFGYCALETLSLLLSTIIAAILLIRKRNGSDIALLPLALLYSSIPTTFFLIVSSVIWRKEYLPSPSSLSTSSSTAASALLDLSPYLSNLQLLSTTPNNTTKGENNNLKFESKWLNYLISFSRVNLKSGLSKVGKARGWASEAVLRKGVGGSSSIVAVAVVLRISKKRAVGVLGIAWIVHLVLLHAIDGMIS
ncbi:hypothetical protein JCM3765_004774 [Sporobolomyces pararoseus]